MSELLNMLSRLQAGELTVAEAAAALGEREVDLGFARVDTDRQKRRGLPEVIFSPGKQPAQMVAIAQALIDAGQNVFATRIRPEQHEVLRAAFPDLVYHDDANAITIDRSACPEPEGCVAVVCAGTSDRPVAAEAALARLSSAASSTFVPISVAAASSTSRAVAATAPRHTRAAMQVPSPSSVKLTPTPTTAISISVRGMNRR